MSIAKLLTFSALLAPLAIVAVESESFTSIAGYTPAGHPYAQNIIADKGESFKDNGPTVILSVVTKEGGRQWRLPAATIMAYQNSEKKYELHKDTPLVNALFYGPGVICSNITKDGNPVLVLYMENCNECDDFKKWFEEQPHSDQDE